jgi:hypothetical protein
MRCRIAAADDNSHLYIPKLLRVRLPSFSTAMKRLLQRSMTGVVQEAGIERELRQVSKGQTRTQAVVTAMSAHPL